MTAYEMRISDWSSDVCSSDLSSYRCHSRVSRSVYYSKGGHDLKDRITKTAKLGYDIGSSNAYAADGEMIVTCVKTRLVHAAVRHQVGRASSRERVCRYG